jgi:hypothetical protein
MAKTKAVQPPAPEKLGWTYDWEIYTNLACVTLIRSHPTEWEEHKFIIYADPRSRDNDINDYRAFVTFMQTKVRVLIGYNNQDYDDPITKHLMLSYDVFRDATASDITTSCKILSDKIIAAGDRKKKRIKEKKRDAYLDNLRARKLFGSLDMLLLFNTIDRVSLKQIAINLRWPEIIDLPFKPSHIVTNREEVYEILYYNRNDVLITKALLIRQDEELRLRRNYGAEVNADVMNANRTNIAKFVIRKYYMEEANVKYDSFKDKRTFYPRLNLGQCISKKITFMTHPYQEAFNKFRNATINPNKLDDEEKTGKKKQFEHILQSKAISHTLGLGGIHSINKPGIITPGADYDLWDIDVESYYPIIMILENLFPAHLGPALLKVYRTKIHAQRLEAKRSGNKLLAEILKIALNSTFGLTKSVYSWMYDPKVTLSITVSGQLYLMMLMERLEMNTGCQVVYSNTDGLTVRVPKNETKAFMSFCQQWESYTGFKLEYNKVRKIVVKDVNNFMMFFEDETKEIKGKGAFLTKKELKSGYIYPIIAKALYEYYTKGTNPELFIKGCNDIYDFMAAIRVSAEKYDLRFYPRNGDEHRIRPYDVLQKSNRWVVTSNNPAEGRLMKYRYPATAEELAKIMKSKTKKKDHYDKESNVQKGYVVTIVNKVEEGVDISAYKLNYDFYIQQTYEIIRRVREIKETKPAPVQGTLL